MKNTDNEDSRHRFELQESLLQAWKKGKFHRFKVTFKREQRVRDTPPRELNTLKASTMITEPGDICIATVGG
jgi:hypothetical protein